MMRSLFSAVSGLKTHQQRMDVIGNNIANVNTPGYKKSRVTFQDMLNQTIRGASRPVEGGRGGTNPMQVGLGVTIGSIDTDFGATSLQDTGKNTDLGINGDGFFILAEKAGGREFYTRAGSFDFDSNGNLVSNLNGLHVLGWDSNVLSSISAGANLPEPSPIKINLSETTPAQATTKMNFSGNLDALLPVSDATKEPSIIIQKTIYDSLGAPYTIDIKFMNVSSPTYPNTWNWEVVKVTPVQHDKIPSKINGGGQICFNPDGTFNKVTQTWSEISFEPTNGADKVVIVPDFSLMTQSAGETTATIQYQNGYSQGDLERITIDQTGTIVGVFSNGVTRNLAQIALARFTNPGGLTKEGNSLYSESSNSGDSDIKPPGSSGFGTVKPATLEMSNVDLSSEFTDMIVTQRGFQANSRVITASDEMLQDLVNLKR